VALFDNDPLKVGELIGPGKVPVYDVKKIEGIVKSESIDVCVIAVPARAAQRVLNQVTAAGVRAVLNFAPASLSARLGVKVKTVDLTISLESLSYFLSSPLASSVTNARRRRALTEFGETKEREL
jgi:redox-sensing transcriptional repressor